VSDLFVVIILLTLFPKRGHKPLPENRPFHPLFPPKVVDMWITLLCVPSYPHIHNFYYDDGFLSVFFSPGYFLPRFTPARVLRFTPLTR
jgi:hypothetical protein